MEGRTPDQFGLSRLKEGERVCGGRGQFGNQPLWNFNDDCRSVDDGLGTAACGCRAVGTLHKGEDLTRSTGWLPESCGFFGEKAPARHTHTVGAGATVVSAGTRQQL